MTYQETTKWLFEKLPMYQMQGAVAYKKDLTNTIQLLDHLKNPEKSLEFVHVAGTNGKGSTSSMLASILQEAGYKVGLYTSPHLKNFTERIKINGIPIEEDFVTRFVKENKQFLEDNNLSFFEMTVGMSLGYFKDKNIDIVIMEVGMGGRLDSTNVITPLVSVITNIGLDHMQFLGNTIQEIASEKAGIIKPNIPVVIGEYCAESKPVFLEKAKECNAIIYFASDTISKSYTTDLMGNYQVHNVKTVLQTIGVLKSTFVISSNSVKKGLLNVIKNTGLLGRWQQINSAPKVICDTAHNAHGLKTVLNQVLNEKFDALHIVLGVVNDKDLDSILPLFPKNAKYYFCSPNISRGLDVLVLQKKAKEYGLIGLSYISVSEAYKIALRDSNSIDFVYIGGSTFVVAEVL